MVEYSHANLLIWGSRSLSQPAAELVHYRLPFLYAEIVHPCMLQSAVLLLYSSKLLSNITKKITCKSTVAITCIHMPVLKFRAKLRLRS